MATGAATCTTGFAAGATTVCAVGGCTATVGRGGVLRASASACFRARIAFSASPGLEMWDRSNCGFVSTRGFVAVVPVR